MGPARSRGHGPRRQPPADLTQSSEVEPSTGFARLHHPAQSDTVRTRRPTEQGAGSWGILGYQYNHISSLGVGFVFFSTSFEHLYVNKDNTPNSIP